MQTSGEKPRRLGKGLSALMGSPAATSGPASSKAGLVGVDLAGTAAGTPGGAGAGATPATSSSGERSTGMNGQIVEVKLDQIVPSPFQPRRTFDEAQLAELAASIKGAGLVQPVIVRLVGGGGRDAGMSAGTSVGGGYELVAGERRWRAAKLAGLTSVPAVVRVLTDEQAAEWALIENLQRTDLSPMERAEAMRTLCERFALSHAQLADKLGMERSSVANMIRLTELEPPIRTLLESGSLSAGHGKALLAVPAGKRRLDLATIASNQGWSVRKLEVAASNAAATATAAGTAGVAGEKAIAIVASDKAVARAAALRDLEKQLGEHLGTQVAIRTSPSGKRGSITLKFYDLDHFDGLMSKFAFTLQG
jgi:ParB family transcriptional regulator, chromosome partitioning protein